VAASNARAGPNHDTKTSCESFPKSGTSWNAARRDQTATWLQSHHSQIGRNRSEFLCFIALLGGASGAERPRRSKLDSQSHCSTASNSSFCAAISANGSVKMRAVNRATHPFTAWPRVANLLASDGRAVPWWRCCYWMDPVPGFD